MVMPRNAGKKPSLTRAVGAAVDEVFTHPHLHAFRKLEQRDGASIRRYYRRTPAAECEVSVYRDKWWDKSGGHIHLELHCLVDEVQQLLGGCSQSWLEPDYTQPLQHFQYSLGHGAERCGWKISSVDDIVALSAGLQDFLLVHALRWFDQLASRDGVIGYLKDQGAYASLAEFHARLDDKSQALRFLSEFLLEYPRDIERVLETMVSVGVISEEENRVLLRGSLQHQDDYARCVQQWRRERGV